MRRKTTPFSAYNAENGVVFAEKVCYHGVYQGIAMYIHELKNWPHFSWDQKRLDDLLIQLRHQQGRLMGGMTSIGFPIQNETVLQNLTQDVIKSSEIEGEILDPSQVRSSVARRLGMEEAALNPLDREVEGVVEMTLDATRKFDQPLTKERLFYWHTSLFPNGRSGFSKISTGTWRTGPVQVVSGQMGKEKIHFEAPSADLVDREMEFFLDWINGDKAIDLVLKAAIAHLWFVTIHPFDDGNGRIARAIADFILARSEASSLRFYSLSTQIQKERKSYYAVLEKTQKGTLNITSWIEWFFHCLRGAIETALSTLDSILHKAHLWEVLAKMPLNERQKKILNRLFDGFEGKLTSSKWAKMTKCSQDTAYRDILDLIHRGILIKSVEGGRNTSYTLATLLPGGLIK